MTFQELITETTSWIHDTSSDVTARAKTAINRTYQDVCSRKNWSWLIRTDSLATAAGTQDYALSDEVDVLLDIRDPTGTAKLVPTTWQDFDAVIPNPTEESNPKYYIPNGTLGIRDQLGSTASTVGLVSTNAADTSTKIVLVYGLVSGAQQVESVTLNGTANTSTVATFSRVDRIVKASTTVGIVRAFANTASAGIACTFSSIKPDAFATEYPHIAIYPEGATTLNYRYKKRVFDMVQTCDTPEIPIRRHEVLVYGALVKLAEYSPNANHDSWQLQYEKMLATMERDDNPTADALPAVRSDREESYRSIARTINSIT